MCSLQTLASTHDSLPVPADVVDALVAASRTLVAVAARSLAAADDGVTLPQYRALVVLGSRGPQTVGQLAEHLQLHPSTTSRLCDRLVAKALVDRAVSPESRREILVSLLPGGQQIVRKVTARRHRDVGAILARVPEALWPSLIAALDAFSAAAGEQPEQAWSLGWS